MQKLSGARVAMIAEEVDLIQSGGKVDARAKFEATVNRELGVPAATKSGP